MDEYIDNITWRLRGYFPMNFMIVPDVDSIINLLKMFPRRDFREQYFNDKKIGFKNIVALFGIAMLQLSPRMFQMLMGTEWCKNCEFINCEILSRQNTLFIDLYFKNRQVLIGDLKLPTPNLDIDKILTSKKFEKHALNRNLYTYYNDIS